MSSESLRQWLAAYCLSRDLSPAYLQQLRLTVDAFCRFAGPDITLAGLNDDLANRWLVSLAEAGKSKETIKTQRRNLLVLWRDGYANGLAVEPKRVRIIKCPRTLPEAWSIAQMRAVLESAEKTRGRFRQSLVSRPAFWRAFVLAAWDTGLRLGDLLRIRREEIGEDGSLVMSQAKTGWPVLCKLSPETMAAIQASFPPYRELVFGGVLHRRHLFKQFREIVEGIGLKGGTKKIRKSSATAIEAAHPGAAKAHLGHQTSGLADRFYIDPRIIQQEKPRPPRLA